MIYAVGDNPIACRLAGVRVWQVLLAVYVMAGLLAAVGGLLFSGDDRVGRCRPDEQLPAAVRRRHRDRGDIDPRRHRRVQRHDPRRPDPHRAQPVAAAPRRQRGVQADAVRRHRARCWPGSTSASPARSPARANDEVVSGSRTVRSDGQNVAVYRRVREYDHGGRRGDRGRGDRDGVHGGGPHRGVAPARARRRRHRRLDARAGPGQGGRGGGAAAAGRRQRRGSCWPTPPSTSSTSPAPTTSTASRCGR